MTSEMLGSPLRSKCDESSDKLILTADGIEVDATPRIFNVQKIEMEACSKRR